jgi:hypothetical protein
LRIIGVTVLIFGLVYPHFLGPQLLLYLYAAPVGIIPCATLLMVTGFTLVFDLKQSQKWMIVLLATDIFYGLFGVLKLHVYLDIFLLIASAALIIQIILSKNSFKDFDGKPLSKKSVFYRASRKGLKYLKIIFTYPGK